MAEKKGRTNTSTIILAVAALVAIAWLIIDSQRDETVVTTAVEAPAVDTGGAPVFRYLDPAAVVLEYDRFKQALPVLDGANFLPGRGDFKTETITVELALDAAIEMKALMQQGDTAVYSWSTDGGDAYYDFHAHDDAGGPEFFTRYSEGESAGDSGSILAGYEGQHGWYWMNISDGPLTITLQIAGFYDEIIELEVAEY